MFRARKHIADCDFELSPYNAPAIITSARKGTVVLDVPRHKVAIVGAGHGKEYAPYNDDEWEVWGLNAVPPLDHNHRLRADRWFEMHVMAAQNDKDMQWIRRCPFPIYLVPDAAECVFAERNRLGTVPKEPDIPTAVRYPLERVEARFGVYWACSFAYQIALALDEGFTDIGLYGVELCFGTMRERTVEWANVSFWVGLAQGMGVNIHLPPYSRLGRHSYRYGIEYYQEKTEVERYVARLKQGDKAGEIDESVGG
jgi:hypothetical protein